MSGASVGIEMAVCIAIGWGIGYLLDRTFGTDPWLMLVFLGCGIAAGFKAMFVAAKKIHPRRAPARDPERGPGSSLTRDTDLPSQRNAP
ncbi:MAG TPA: AtpZ/AtpI family protein [Kofleriaceae bacterium]|nr:AtpZ/AtpI family protein [Kofleriaceae bacterium]